MLRLTAITKRFGGTLALDNVNLDVAKGEVVAIIGENGAGKSTLMKIVGGVFPPDQGKLFLEGEQLQFHSPADVLARGIRVIYQELSCLENLSVAQNIFLGIEPKRGPLVDGRTMHRRATQILKHLDMEIDSRTILGELSVAQLQMIEIARSLTSDLKVLVLDEPTSSLTVRESENLFRVVRELSAKGVSVLLITHRLDEIGQIADRVLGLRDGKNSGELTQSEISHNAMISLMVGRELNRPDYSAPKLGAIRLTICGLKTDRFPDETFDLDVHSGEIVTLAGLIGSGRTEIARALFGIDRCTGTVRIDGKVVSISCPADAIKAGLVLVPEDRKREGLTTTMTLKENVLMPIFDRTSKVGIRDADSEMEIAQIALAEFEIKAQSAESVATEMSGGNQQKVVLARWLNLNPKVLVVDEPTRGIDVGSKLEIYLRLRALADCGTAILMISSDMEEVLAMSDRIAVMRSGAIAGTLSHAQATREEIMKLATHSPTNSTHGEAA